MITPEPPAAPSRELLERLKAERCFGWNNQIADPCDCPVDTCRVADWVMQQPDRKDEPHA